MTSSLQVGILILSREVRLPLLSLTELDEKLSTTTILGIIVNKPSQTVIGLHFSENVFHH